MEELKSTGKYAISDDMKARLSDFASGFATEDATDSTIKYVYDRTGYVMDTHTAVAAHVCEEYKKSTGDSRKCVVASTASPYKFVKSVMKAINAENAKEDEFTLLPKLNEASGVEMPQAIKDILEANVLHHIECDRDQMECTVKEILKL